MTDIKWADDNLNRYRRQIVVLNKRFPHLIPREINKVGARAKTLVIRTLTKQTGLPRETIVKAVGNPSQARPGKLSYDMVTRGGMVRLKFFDPKETAKGVSAQPFGKRSIFPKTFMEGGKFPDRKEVEKFKGHVMFRNRSKGRHYTFARSEVAIPVEMTKGQTKAAFVRIAGPLLQIRIEKLIEKNFT